MNEPEGMQPSRRTMSLGEPHAAVPPTPEERRVELWGLAEHVWEDPAKANAWLGSPQAELGGGVPLRVAATEEGFRAARTALAKLEHSLPV